METGDRRSDDPSPSRLVESIREIASLPECRNCCRKMYANLVRRIKLLSPLFEELRDGGGGGGGEAGGEEEEEEDRRGFEMLGAALDSAVAALRSVNQGSKLYQAFQIDKNAAKFHQLTGQIEAALSMIPYERLDISEEVREQIELVHAQFKRANGIMDSPDLQLVMDLDIAQKEKEPDLAVLKRLSEKLQLKTLNDLKKESLAIHELVISSGGEPANYFEKMASLLKKLRTSVIRENPEVDTFESEKGSMKHRSPVIPDDFRCPISLELMKDPVIVSTGQTYERLCIQRWLDAGHKTCPKTQQTLLHTALTPNYVLKSLIALWCESNGVELPEKQGKGRSKRSGRVASECDRAAIDALLEKLANGNPEQQRGAAGELRLLAKRNADNRVCIAEAGAIPLLVDLLSSPDSRTQEHAVTALLNLSINESNKGTIVNAGAISDIVDVLKNGSMEARENAAATLFSLSVIDENKVAIGAAGAIPALIRLLCEGTPRGKKDAATAIFNLSIYQGNKARAIKAGIVGPLMRLLKDAGGGMVDEALAILAILASHLEGRTAISQAEPIPVLVEVIRTGSPRNRENAAAVLWSLCSGDVEQLKFAKDLGAEEVLKELMESGTDRAKRKAGTLLELIQRAEPAPEL
ncbi:U-box domain-containing protein 14 [Syzygium oleosum]|uniref:U-box domain-containing protein 14 n=1 Tax=Syzygium oleosum TaxID=219896 RepID=UPI0011D18D1D|nr:U-box domain-containing protein 14 [Syzygium oleosum]